MKKYLLILLITALVITLVSCNSRDLLKKKQSYTKEQIVPTFYLHGYKGTVNSTQFLTHAANKAHNHPIVYADVDAKGRVHLKGRIDKYNPSPIVVIKLEDNQNGDLDTNALWVKHAIEKVYDEQKFDKFNMVMHSMGNLSFSYYMLNYGNDKHLPQLNKQVNIAGTFNGILNINDKVNANSIDKNGKPKHMTREFKHIVPMRDNYKNKGIKILNIYGDLDDGTNSDGRVSNVSSLSLKYILGSVVSQYETYKVSGEEGDHSALHDSDKVASKINAFLWDE
ncbi:alpha/beta hydrolase [Staphylococcus sp. SQ8-PEA]|uniref:Alpha/beta hydrolase n=1 Tax=Staphylococcus marylandisciuri TaxID=2981529 RepID=A0ABT2QME2_9STAP|nr:alpha/beta hydrolase [Staphylococcus marylandisciuri]MCU5745119.1 alpha/beta hydrolase [Staphylococcus marylandisciuri]